jgi:hypothetical protein
MVERFLTGDQRGWVKVRYLDGNHYEFLPQYLRVDYHGTADGADVMTVLEGKSAGKIALVQRRNDGASYLRKGAPWRSGAEILYARDSRILWYGLHDSVRAITHVDPHVYGTFDLEIPDTFHRGGLPYESKSVYAGTWFRIGHQGERYLHAGYSSAGCVTVTDVAAWTGLYSYLIRRRKGDGISVGVLRVIGDDIRVRFTDIDGWGVLFR